MQHVQRRNDKETGKVTPSFTFNIEKGKFWAGECIFMLG